MSETERAGGQGAEFPDDPAAAGLWDVEDAGPLPLGMPDLHLEGFDGPMDLLLDLAERQRIDLGRMSVLALAEQFVAAMERLSDQVPIEQRAEWLVMATRLVLLRSRLLSPRDAEAAAETEQEAGAALRRVEILIQIRAAANWLSRQPQLGADVFARPSSAVPARGTGYVALMEACLAVLRRRGGQPELAPLYRPVIPDLWRVRDALVWIRRVLGESGGEARGLGAFLPRLPREEGTYPLKARAAVASTFLAGLELARDGEISMEQAVPFQQLSFASNMAVAD